MTEYKPIHVEICDYSFSIPDLNLTIDVGLDGGDHLHIWVKPNGEDFHYHKRIWGMNIDNYHINNVFRLDEWINKCIEKGCVNINSDGYFAEMIVWDDECIEQYNLRYTKNNDFFKINLSEDI